MSQPSPVGAIVAELDVTNGNFPFFWWAVGARFQYPEAARHLFAKTGSAAEAFFLQPAASFPGVEFLPDRLAWNGLEVIPQLAVARARIDFAVHKGRQRFAVEIDGREFHHRSNEQLDADYLRERRILSIGYTVVRFTAVESFRNPGECWRQLLAIVDRTPIPDAA